MRRLHITLSDPIYAFLAHESTRIGRSVVELLRQYITDRPEFKAYVKNTTTVSELPKSVERPHVRDLELDDERRPQFGETLVVYRARLAKSGLVEPLFDTDPPWVD